jgi:predicted glycosyltransferase
MNIINAHGGGECPEELRHDHELLGSVMIAERGEDPHNHRFATVTGPAMPAGRDDHIHEVKFRTDFYEDHFHEFHGRTLGAVKVGDRHVHFLEDETTCEEGHRHKFRAATLIQDPIGEEHHKKEEHEE